MLYITVDFYTKEKNVSAAEYLLGEALEAKKTVRAELQTVLQDNSKMQPRLRALVRGQIDRLSREIAFLNRQLGTTNKPTISVCA